LAAGLAVGLVWAWRDPLASSRAADRAVRCIFMKTPAGG